eukprot:Skav231789  [mRNA]  locus=scaffold734:5945:6679:- [translate_table: standard]
MAPKKITVTVPTEGEPMSEEEMEQIIQLIQMLELETLEQETASSSTDDIATRMGLLEKNIRDSALKHQVMSKEFKKREKEIRDEQRKLKQAADKETKKNDALLRRTQPITINIRFGLGGLMFSMTIAPNTTLGEFRRLVWAHFNSLTPVAHHLPKKAVTKLMVFLGETPLHENPRKTLEHLGVVSGVTISVLTSGTTNPSSASSSAAAGGYVAIENDQGDNEEGEEDEEDDASEPSDDDQDAEQ